MKRLERFFNQLSGNNRYTSAFLIAICFLVHSPTLFNGYNLDDELVTRNHRLTSKGVSAIPEIYSSPYYEDDMGYSYGYRPTVLASFAIEHSIFGESPFVGHLINLLLYTLTVVLISFLILNLFPDQWWLAFGVALLFAVHPIHTEVVASLKNRDEILALLFGLSGCYVFLKSNNSFWSFPIVALFFALSLTSKVSAVGVILIMATATSAKTSYAKDGILILAYCAILYFIFDQRGTASFQRFSLFLFALGFLVIRFIYHGNQGSRKHRLLATKFFQRLVAKISVGINKIIGNLKNLFEKQTNRLSLTYYRFLDITTASLIAYWLMSFEDGLIFPSILFAAVLFSFLLFPSGKLDAFIRFSIMFALLGDEVYKPVIFIFLTVCYSLLTCQSSFKKIWGYYLLGFVVQFFLLEIDITGIIGMMVTCLLILLSRYIADTRFKWAQVLHVVLVIFLYVTSVLLFEKSFRRSFMFPFLVTAPVIVFRISKILQSKLPVNQWRYSPSLRFQRVFTSFILALSSSLLVLGFAMATIGPYMESVPKKWTQRAEVINALKKELKTHVNPNYDPDKVWSSKDLFAWERPFDYVEHPLSPVAPITWKLGTAMNTLQAYLNHLLVPHPLSFYYGYNEVSVNKLTDWKPLISTLFHILLLAGVILCRQKFKPISIGLLIYLVSIFLFSGLVEMVAGMFAERFAYVASFGFSLAFVGLLIHIGDKLPKFKYPVILLSLIVLTIFSAHSFHRNTLWKDKVTLMRHDIKNVPNSAQAHNLLAHALMENVFGEESDLDADEEENQILEAREHFMRATEIYPPFFNAWVDIGKVNDILNKPELAIASFERALALDSTYSPLFNWTAENAEKLGQLNKATLNFQEYLSRSPKQPEAYNNLARVLFKQGRYTESLGVCKGYLKIDPTNETFKGNVLLLEEKIREENKTQEGN